MFPHPDTYCAVFELERNLALKRAERRALVIEATKRPGSTHAVAGAAVGQARSLLRAGIAQATFSGALKLAGAIRRPV